MSQAPVKPSEPTLGMDSRIIFVDGLMGTGKSTTAEFISTVLRETGSSARFIPEGERPHPTKVGKVRSVGEYVDSGIRKWSRFVADVQDAAEVFVLDGQLFHFNVDEMLFLDATPSEILDYVMAIDSLTEPLAPSLVYYYAENWREELERVFSARGDGWLARQTAWKTATPYCQHRGLSGLEGLLSLYGA